MDVREGCCIASYVAYDMSKVDRIMLRFRPIAPKPMNLGSGSGGSSPEMSEPGSKSGRGKRRHNTARGNYSKRRNNNSSAGKRKGLSAEKVGAVVTLPLLPETPERKESQEKGPLVELPSANQTTNASVWLGFGREERDRMVMPGGFGVSGNRTPVVAGVTKVVVGSCVTVECVTDTWVDVDELGRTDDERRANLEKDACPGFISDYLGRVTWTNDAYREMVGQTGGGCGAEMMVWLSTREKAPVTATVSRQVAFTCRVRVQYEKVQNTCGNNGKERSSITVPCDVWRMDGGGFAWRLDVKAALCLGRFEFECHTGWVRKVRSGQKLELLFHNLLPLYRCDKPESRQN